MWLLLLEFHEDGVLWNAQEESTDIIISEHHMGGLIFLIISSVHLFEGKSDSVSISLLGDLLWSSYWFLKAVFLCYIIAWIGVNSRIWNPLWIITTCLLVQFCPHFNIPLMYPCFVIGMFLKQIIDKDWFVRFRFLYFFCFVLCLLFWTKDFAGDYEQTLERISPLSVEFLQLIVFRCYKLLMGISASFFMIAIFRKYLWNLEAGKTKIGNRAFQCGAYSMGVYLLQTLLLEYTLKKFISFDAINRWLFNIVVAPGFSLTVLLICVWIIKTINRKRWLSLFYFGTNYVK